VASLEGSRYYVTFIDDFSRKVWVYFLKNKFDVFETFKKWKAMVETESGLKLKCLRSDNGGEYIDGGFKEIAMSMVSEWKRPFQAHHNRTVLLNG